MSIEEVEQQIRDELESFDDWMEKYEYIIDQGKQLEPLEESQKTSEALVQGCQSRVWVVLQKEGDMLRYMIDSDALIVKGLAALLLRILNGRTKEEIVNYTGSFFTDIGLMQHISPARSNGLVAMLQTMKKLVE